MISVSEENQNSRPVNRWLAQIRILINVTTSRTRTSQIKDGFNYDNSTVFWLGYMPFFIVLYLLDSYLIGTLLPT